MVAALACASAVFTGSMVSDDQYAGFKPFQDYYQLGTTDESDETEAEPSKQEKELTGHMEGSHSLFGLIWQIAGTTGWTVQHILWNVSYPLLLLMAADAPKYVKSTKKDGKRRGNRGSALKLFQTILKEKDKE